MVKIPKKQRNLVIKNLFDNAYEMWMSPYLAKDVSNLPGVYKVETREAPKYFVELDSRYYANDVLRSIKELAKLEVESEKNAYH